MTAFGSMAATMIFAVYNGFLGIHHASLWHGSICVYYLVLILLRGMIVAAAKKISKQEKPGISGNRVYLTVSFLLLFLNFCLIVPIAIMIKQQKPVHLTLIPAITMAVYTTYKIIMASIHLRKRKTSSDNLVRLLRTISFIDALVSILTLQNTLIMVQSNGEGTKILPVTIASSTAVWVAILLLSVVSIAQAIRSRKS